MFKKLINFEFFTIISLIINIEFSILISESEKIDLNPSKKKYSMVKLLFKKTEKKIWHISIKIFVFIILK